MQILSEITSITALGAAIVALVVGLYLFYLWNQQDVQMYYDLPFLFGITFIAMFLNLIIQSLPGFGIIEYSLLLFKIRTLVIFGTVFPLLAAILIIWFMRYQRYHNKILAALAIYWFVIDIFGTDEALIMILLIPIVFIIILGLIATFLVTWRTNRLKEVRSDLLVLSLISLIISQAGGVALRSMNLDWIVYLINAIATLLAAISFANPWYRRNLDKKQNP
ncbi:MAG: conserved membrane protein of unknown function [Candidatus Thorarchaeota archaeon]|nr:MAG: conserved membrane protein of unknown function [Candidatus Thorarchaeota archaeon]